MRQKKRHADEVALPALLRAARNTYASAIREPLATAGFDDVPRNGIFVIAAISRTGAPLSEVIQWLGVSKQAAGQLVDTLVLRGYLERCVDSRDRRRLKVGLTQRGRAVASICRAAVERVDQELLKSVGSEYIDHTRSTLMSLAAQARHSAQSNPA